MHREQEFTISEVSRITNTPCHTLRFWEKEFTGILEPLRTKGGQRRYTEETVVLIEQIRRFREDGISLARIKRSLDCGEEEPVVHDVKIDLLAKRVSAIIRNEIYNFFAEIMRNEKSAYNRYNRSGRNVSC